MIQPLSTSLYTKIRNLRIFGYTSAARFIFRLFPKKSLVLTNASRQKDGYGAQLQRVLSIKALSDNLNRVFQLTPLSSAERQVTQSLASYMDLAAELDEFNHFLKELLSSKVSDNKQWPPIELDLDNCRSLKIIVKAFVSSILFGNPVKFALENAYSFLNPSPDLYRTMKIHTTPLSISRADDCIQIHVHLRYVNFANDSERFLDSNYYIVNLDHITSLLLENKHKYRIMIHSDFGTELPTYSSVGILSDTQQHLESIGILSTDGAINDEVFKSAISLKNKIRDSYQYVEDMVTENALSSLIQMANADYLICSKSSFSYVSGILNYHGEVFSPDYWNKPLSTWQNRYKS